MILNDLQKILSGSQFVKKLINKKNLRSVSACVSGGKGNNLLIIFCVITIQL